MNSSEIVESERIKSLVEKGIAQVLDAKYCEEFDDFLCSEYPWQKYTDKIDWDMVKTPYKRFKWSGADVKETINFFQSTCMRDFDEICIVYGAKQRGLVVKFDYAIENLRSLTVFGWATRALVAVKRNNYIGTPLFC